MMFFSWKYSRPETRHAQKKPIQTKQIRVYYVVSSVFRVDIDQILIEWGEAYE